MFGQIAAGEMQLNGLGSTVQKEWKRLPDSFPLVHLGAFMIMPNHIHGIIVIEDPVGATHQLPDNAISSIDPKPNVARLGPVGSPEQSKPTNPHSPKRGSLGAIIGQFKSRVTKRIRSIPGYNQAPIWQCNYYEHVIRDKLDWQRIHEYILMNPLRWGEDSLNTDYIPK